MHRPRAGRGVSCARRHVVILRSGFRDHFNSRSDAVAVAFGSLKLELQPMIVAGTLIDPYLRRRVDRAYYDVEAAISVQVADG
jgi:hypothetical protein